MNFIRKASVIKRKQLPPTREICHLVPRLSEFQRSSIGCQSVQLFRATDANQRRLDTRHVTMVGQSDSSLRMTMADQKSRECLLKIRDFFLFRSFL